MADDEYEDDGENDNDEPTSTSVYVSMIVPACLWWASPRLKKMEAFIRARSEPEQERNGFAKASQQSP